MDAFRGEWGRPLRPVVATVVTMVVATAAVVGMVGGSPAASAAVTVAMTADVDGDGDGIDDGLEDALASQFFPWVWFDSGENSGCTDPATATNPGTALARVRPHPGDASRIAIQYVILYRRDCGDFLGFSGHRGDVEPLAVTLAPNGACPYGYGAWSAKTVAHEGTSTEHIDQTSLGNSCTWGRLAGGSPSTAKIYSSENKHGNYLWDATCDAAGVWGSENCSESFTRQYEVFNVGEDGARRIDELSAYRFPGEYAWSAVPFRGSAGSGSGDAGLVRDKFLQDRLLAPT